MVRNNTGKFGEAGWVVSFLWGPKFQTYEYKQHATSNEWRKAILKVKEMEETKDQFEQQLEHKFVDWQKKTSLFIGMQIWITDLGHSLPVSPE